MHALEHWRQFLTSLASAGWQNYPWAALIATLSAVGVLMLEGCIQAFYERAHTAAAATDAPADVEAKDSAAMLGSPLGTQTDGVAAHPHGGHALDLAVKEDKIRLLTIALVCPAPAAAPAHCDCCTLCRTQAQRAGRVLAPQANRCSCERTDRPPRPRRCWRRASRSARCAPSSAVSSHASWARLFGDARERAPVAAGAGCCACLRLQQQMPDEDAGY